MEKQTYKNHIRYYIPHHFVFYPVLLLCIAGSSVGLLRYPNQHAIWLAMTALFILTGWLSFMVRQHYALTNQNRIVRLELRLRYYQLTHQRFEPLEKRLSLSQLFALRFAPDDELLLLIERTLAENLPADQIKRSITNWLPDTMRV
jgi:hypothetical protein